MYSVTRAAWTPAEELQPGEVLITRDSSVSIAANERSEVSARVYNLQVETEACYYVTSEYILSHNTNPCAAGEVPQKARDVVSYAKQKKGAAQQGHKGGRKYENDGRDNSQILPKTDANGNPITYKEYDVHPYQKGINRGQERVVIGSDGRAYYTSSHYKKFVEVK